MNHRELLTSLRELGDVRAPTTLLENVIDAVGLGDQYAELTTPLGPVFVAWNRLGVSAVMKTATPQEFETRFKERFLRTPRPAPGGPPPNLGVGQKFDLRSVTEFERAVLLKAREIPKGEVRTYGWIADQIGHPAAVRAVGSALRKNPVPVLIPCHRVVRSDGHIGDYALGGSANKRAILAAEGVRPEAVARFARESRPTRAKVV
ncbi:MAG: MGMT family protein [Chloroflexi bacterium]|nr:MGMT family protein [Chloroflexota bacterium]